ncbi:MAG: hypothetical protein ACWA6X_12490 [Bauldia sp.]|jgi:hypothetical protein
MREQADRRTGLDQPGTWEIRVAGLLGPRWAARFGVEVLAHMADGTTAIRRRLVDQAALHGMLQAIRDLGLPLVSVTRIDAAKSE